MRKHTHLFTRWRLGEKGLQVLFFQNLSWSCESVCVSIKKHSLLKVLVWKNVCFCVVTEVCGKSAVFHVSFQFNDRLFGALYFVFHARDVITINHYWEKYTSLPSFQIKEQNRWEISSLEQNYKVTYHTITSLWVVFGLSRPSTYLCVLDKHVMVDPTPALLGVNPHN